MVTLRLVDVGVRYGRRPVLSGITTPEIAGGTVTAVIGPNATGKSSLFRRIAGLLEGPGEVRVSDPRPDAVCYMPQDTAANTVLTVYESVLLARKQRTGWSVAERDLVAVDAALDRLRIRDLAFRGLGELSGGQRQLVSLAQTIVREPSVVLLDEPTSALDLHRQIEVVDLIRSLARERGLCALVALHDLALASRLADGVIVLSDGRMHACGPAREVITDHMLRTVYRVDGRVSQAPSGRLAIEIHGALDAA
ncbi:ABC transporter ATP-binding protein [Chthonobacter rhizosphaerae]|uniref:ABC transporter ATP-binding protein n=1 Tax=Chthonobacter rhizosphaerae TaxID=2735553 RepID=UPI0015EF0227|nr:ABC transporter ATP-binding protein [Chthonobacter rhizosphaerae]